MIYKKQLKKIRTTNNNLVDQIQMLQSINLSLQWQLTIAQRKINVQCDHKYDCGCDRELCHNCNLIANCNHCVGSGEYVKCTWCGKPQKPCSDVQCKNYYNTRFDNCKCDSIHCIFCNSRKATVIEDESSNSICHTTIVNQYY